MKIIKPESVGERENGKERPHRHSAIAKTKRIAGDHLLLGEGRCQTKSDVVSTGCDLFHHRQCLCASTSPLRVFIPGETEELRREAVAGLTERERRRAEGGKQMEEEVRQQKVRCSMLIEAQKKLETKVRSSILAQLSANSPVLLFLLNSWKIRNRRFSNCDPNFVKRADSRLSRAKWKN